MLTKTILVALLAACAAPVGAAANPNQPESTDPPQFTPPPEPPQERETYWCCNSINSGKASGDGCEEILVTKVVLCDKVLHCSGGYTYDDGKVTCLGLSRPMSTVATKAPSSGWEGCAGSTRHAITAS